MDNGKLYMQDDDGKVYPLGEIKDISAEEAEISEEDNRADEKIGNLFGDVSL